MNDDDVRMRLQSLPPELPVAPARFDEVGRRVRRRRRAQGIGIVAGVALVAIAVPVALQLASDGGSDSGRGIDPAVPTGSSVAAGAEPGADHVVELSGARVHEGTGTESVPLGARPAGATGTQTSLTCLSPGRIRWADGASMTCGEDEVGSTSQYVVDRGDGDELLIRADADVRWRIETTYVQVETTDWGVNANGDTYGVENSHGSPDLISVVATNGRSGYAYADALSDPWGAPSSPEEALEQQDAHRGETATIPVYESDGETVVGEFELQPGA